LATKAFVLIETEVGKPREVAERLRGVAGVDGVDAVSGPYDVVAAVTADNLNALGDLVAQEIHTVPGVLRTVTCLAVGAAT